MFASTLTLSELGKVAIEKLIVDRISENKLFHTKKGAKSAFFVA